MSRIRARTGFETMRGIHYEIRALALFGVGQLPRQDGVELFAGHVVARQNPLALNFRRRRDHHHRIDALLAAGLEQQRHIDHRDGRAGLLGVVEEFLTGGAAASDERSARAASSRPGHAPPAPKACARSTLPSAVVPGKRRLDRGHRLAFVNLVNGRVGIVNRNAGFREQLGGG